MERIPKSGEIYRHFKNKKYQIVGIATHSETKEPLVIYQALYGNFGMYARPLAMFTSEVDHEKYPDVTQKYRFTKIELDEAGNEHCVEETDASDSGRRVPMDQVPMEQAEEADSRSGNVFLKKDTERPKEKKPVIHHPAESMVGTEEVRVAQKRDRSMFAHKAPEATDGLSDEDRPDPKLMEYLDAETFDEKYNVLVSMQDCITDKLVDDIAVVMDVVIPEGELMTRYDALKTALRTKQRYEYANRLR